MVCYWGVQFGRTALMFAAQGGHAAVAEVLLRKGAEPRVTDMVNDIPVVFVFLSMPLTQSLPCRKGRLL